MYVGMYVCMYACTYVRTYLDDGGISVRHGASQKEHEREGQDLVLEAQL